MSKWRECFSKKGKPSRAQCVKHGDTLTYKGVTGGIAAAGGTRKNNDFLTKPISYEP